MRPTHLYGTVKKHQQAIDCRLKNSEYRCPFPVAGMRKMIEHKDLDDIAGMEKQKINYV
jgi:hypothetical protein